MRPGHRHRTPGHTVRSALDSDSSLSWPGRLSRSRTADPAIALHAGEAAGVSIISGGIRSSRDDDPSASLEPPKVKGDKALRKVVVALILINIALAIAQSWSRPIALPSRIDCCRDEGPEAYCCKQCCWIGFDCTTNEECQDS